jgi:membrane-associated phospholipid phosphatase
VEPVAALRARPQAAPVRGRALAAVGALLFAAVAVVVGALVHTGRFQHFDQYSVSHLMPWLEPVHHSSAFKFALPEHRDAGWGTVVGLVIYPASIPISVAIVALCALLLVRRGRSTAAFSVCIAFVWGMVIALIGKATIERPETLHQTSWGKHGYTHGFDQSLPSGHTIRAILVAMAISQVARTGKLAYLWALAVPPALVAIGDHTPTDVIAGLGVGFALVFARYALRPDA